MVCGFMSGFAGIVLMSRTASASASVDSTIQNIIKGIILILAVSLDSISCIQKNKRLKRSAQ